MAAKNKIKYICSSCGFISAKWVGKCPGCSEWNTMEESVVETSSAKASGVLSSLSQTRNSIQRIDEISYDSEVRYLTGLKEFDRVLGGGIVKGSLILISGDPGIGKSTILLQVCQYIGQEHSILYISGEESARQIKLRTDRLSVNTYNLMVLTETDVHIARELIKSEKHDWVKVDSSQNMKFT